MEYEEFLKSKQFKIVNKSIEIDRSELNQNLFEYQKDLVYLALKKAKFALFAMTGTGKTAMQGEWAYQIHKKTNKAVLILAPLAVSNQTITEVKNILGYDVNLCKSQSDVVNGINITNYEKLHLFDLSFFEGIALDESSILKSFNSATKQAIIDGFESTPFKLACTATPAPNDHMELGNHSEFLNVMSRVEMLSMFFVHDGGDTSKWRLKKHAENKYWEWVAHWAAVFTKPSDLGYGDDEDKKYSLPKKNTYEHLVASKSSTHLFAVQAETLLERKQARRDSLKERCELAANIVNNSDDIFLLWCDLNSEGDMLKSLIPNSVQISGSDKDEVKSRTFNDFSDGKIRVLITKAKIAGFGMNWQVCHNMVFVGLSDSFEQMFQAERRCYRFGQKNDVNVHIVTSEAEGSVKNNIERKEKDYIKMLTELVKHTKDITLKEIKQVTVDKTEYNPSIEMVLPKFLKSEDK